MRAKRDGEAAPPLDYRAMGPSERFKTKVYFNSLKRLVGLTALADLAVKLLAVALAPPPGAARPSTSWP